MATHPSRVPAGPDRGAIPGAPSGKRSPRRVAALAAGLFLAVAAAVLPGGGRPGSSVGPTPAYAQERRFVAARCQATVVTEDLGRTGMLTIRLEITPEEPLAENFGLALVLAADNGKRELLSWTHPPAPPTSKWKPGEAVVCEVVSPFPAELLNAGGGSGAGAEAGAGARIEEIQVLLGFRDPESGTIYPPSNGWFVRPGFSSVARFTPPEFPALTEDAKVAEILASAEELAKAGRKPEAWSALEFGYRLAVTDAVKLRFRDALVRLGEFAAKPLTEVEKQVVQRRIDEERERYLRQMSGRFWDQGKLHAALRILEQIGGRLKEQADAAVLGALGAAKRAERDVADLRERIVERISDAEKKEVEETLTGLGRTKMTYERALEFAKAGQYAQARALLKELGGSPEAPKEIREQAREQVKVVEKAWIAAIPPAEKLLADAELNHPAFARTAVSLSHEFVFIGPKTLVDSIPAASRRDFDLAYVILTDLFGRRPNPSGDRVTVYFKELWDFGGGVGGGKTIDIGNAKPDATGTRVDTGLLFHELVHCIDDTNPIHAGFREGLADFGTACAHEMLGRGTDAQAAFGTALGAFRKDFVERDLEYFRIPNYGPSAGFFLSFVDKYGRNPGGPGTSGLAHDWKGYRQFFREYRLAPVRDGREHCVIRAMAHFLVRAFGPGVLDDLRAWRFPLTADDLKAVAREMALFAEGDDAVSTALPETQDHANSQLRRDLLQRDAVELLRAGGDPAEVRGHLAGKIGTIFDWHVIGPFEPDGADPGAQIFPPERVLDFAAEYPQRMNTAKWRLLDPANPQRPVQIDPLGWVLVEYSYMDHTATYGLTHVTVDADTEAFVWLRADDDVALFVAGERIDGFGDRGGNASTTFPWRGAPPHAPDAIRFPVTLRKGRTPILVKVRNHGGPAGFSAAIAQRDGRPIPSLRTDTLPPDATKSVPAAPKWKEPVRIDFAGKAALGKLDMVVGGLDVANKLASGTSVNKGVAWRKYTVRPGFPKDSPSNLFWLKSNLTEGMTDFRLTVRLAPRQAPPKLAVTFHGEGNADGLSGWNLLLWDSGGKLGGQLERYEDLWYQWTPVATARKPDEKGGRGGKKDDRKGKDAPPDDPDELVLTVVGNRITCTMNDVPVLVSAPVRPIPGRTRIGFSTWGPDPKFDSIELERTK